MTSFPRFEALLLTCEHASNAVPRRYLHVFETTADRNLLKTHRGFDIGARFVARGLAKRLSSVTSVAGPFDGAVSRLLVDLNRSPSHSRLFSEFSRRLPVEDRKQLMLDYYLPHHQRVRNELARLLSFDKQVLHVGVHSFTPVLGEKTRNADIGLLYDPARRVELAFSLSLQAEIKASAPWLRVRRNYPYRGTDDGLTTSLRREISSSRYAGVELELNQRLLSTKASCERTVDAVVAALKRTLG